VEHVDASFMSVSPTISEIRLTKQSFRKKKMIVMIMIIMKNQMKTPKLLKTVFPWFFELSIFFKLAAWSFYRPILV